MTFFNREWENSHARRSLRIGENCHVSRRSRYSTSRLKRRSHVAIDREIFHRFYSKAFPRNWDMWKDILFNRVDMNLFHKLLSLDDDFEHLGKAMFTEEFEHAIERHNRKKKRVIHGKESRFERVKRQSPRSHMERRGHIFLRAKLRVIAAD